MYNIATAHLTFFIFYFV